TGTDAAGENVTIGKSAAGGFLKADVAEIIAIAGATIDATDMTMLEAYLDKKYGL
ncbi:MAG: hypothetical protein QOI41_1444, partial [Myxococcales bacterium]|nr:hypothetical protein [Myxococcales bacterium]